MLNEPNGKKYDFTISFAGQDRAQAEIIVAGLKAKGATVFYDNDELAELLGKDLYEHLITIYRDSAKYCIMLISENYQSRLWTNHERKAAQNRAFNSAIEYILPIRLDDTNMVSLLDTVGYIDYRKLGSEKVIDILITKLWGRFRDDPVLDEVNKSLAALFQRVGLICEHSLKPADDPDVYKVLPFDVFQGGQSMIEKIRRTLDLKKTHIDHLVLEKLLKFLDSCVILMDLCIFLVQRLDSRNNKIRVIEHPCRYFFNLIELNNLIGIRQILVSEGGYSPDFMTIIDKWSVALTEENKVVGIDSEALSKPRNDLIAYDLSVLKQIPGKIDGQILEVYRTIEL